jgi:hypothetical protein
MIYSSFWTIINIDRLSVGGCLFYQPVRDIAYFTQALVFFLRIWRCCQAAPDNNWFVALCGAGMQCWTACLGGVYSQANAVSSDGLVVLIGPGLVIPDSVNSYNSSIFRLWDYIIEAQGFRTG